MDSDAKRREYQRRYYATHREQAKAYQRKYNETHKKSSTGRQGSRLHTRLPRIRLSEAVTAGIIQHTPNPVSLINGILAGRIKYVPALRRG